MSAERRPQWSAFLWLACAMLLFQAVQILGIALVVGYGAAAEQMSLDFVFGGHLVLTSSYLWLFFVPASLFSIVAVWKERQRPHGGPVLAAAILWLFMGALVAADIGASDPMVTSALQLLVAGLAYLRTRAYRAAMDRDGTPV